MNFGNNINSRKQLTLWQMVFWNFIYRQSNIKHVYCICVSITVGDCAAVRTFDWIERTFQSNYDRSQFIAEKWFLAWKKSCHKDNASDALWYYSFFIPWYIPIVFGLIIIIWFLVVVCVIIFPFIKTESAFQIEEPQTDLSY